MAKQSIFGRMSTMIRANVNAMLDSSEDPGKMLDQMVRDFSNNIAEAEDAVAGTVGNTRMMEHDYQEHVEESQKWEQKALSASERADSHRKKGETEDAEKFDNLARVAIQRQVDAENSAKGLAPSIESQNSSIEQLRTGLEQMRAKRDQLVSKRDELVARSHVAETQARVQGAMKQLDAQDPTSEIGRFEDAVRRSEASARGQAELAASSLEAQFEELTDGNDDDIEVEARLAALKSGSGADNLLTPPDEK